MSQNREIYTINVREILQNGNSDYMCWDYL